MNRLSPEEELELAEALAHVRQLYGTPATPAVEQLPAVPVRTSTSLVGVGKPAGPGLCAGMASLLISSPVSRIYLSAYKKKF
jgi:hypothetical protein